MREKGFTLMELAVTIAIIGILAAVATPAIIRWLPDYRLKGAARDLFSNLQRAKMTAVKANTNVVLAFNQPIGGVAFDYAVFVDINNNLEYDAGEAMITGVRFSEYRGVNLDPAQGGGTGLNCPLNDDGLPAVAFRGNGLVRDNTGNPPNGDVTVFFRNTNGRTLSVIVSPAGNIRIN